MNRDKSTNHDHCFRIQKPVKDAASGVKYKSFFEKTDSVVTYKIEYNFNVDEIAE